MEGKVKKCKTCKGTGFIGQFINNLTCGVCEGIGVDMVQLRSRCEYYGAEYECNKTTSEISEYKDECAQFFGKSKYKLLPRWQQTILNQSFKKGRDKERGL